MIPPRKKRVRRLRGIALSLVWLTLVWVLLWGDWSLGTLAAGLVIAVAVVVGLPMPAAAGAGRVHPVSFAYLVWRFTADLVLASIQVAGLALQRKRVTHGAVIGVRLRSQSDVYLTLTAALCSLVPGSIIVEAHRLTGVLYVHILDVEQSGGVEKARQHVLATEARVLRALASDAELAVAGLTRIPERVLAAKDRRRKEVTR